MDRLWHPFLPSSPPWSGAEAEPAQCHSRCGLWPLLSVSLPRWQLKHSVSPLTPGCRQQPLSQHGERVGGAPVTQALDGLQVFLSEATLPCACRFSGPFSGPSKELHVPQVLSFPVTRTFPSSIDGYLGLVRPPQHRWLSGAGETPQTLDIPLPSSLHLSLYHQRTVEAINKSRVLWASNLESPV